MILLKIDSLDGHSKLAFRHEVGESEVAEPGLPWRIDGLFADLGCFRGDLSATCLPLFLFAFPNEVIKSLLVGDGVLGVVFVAVPAFLVDKVELALIYHVEHNKIITLTNNGTLPSRLPYHIALFIWLPSIIDFYTMSRRTGHKHKPS